MGNAYWGLTVDEGGVPPIDPINISGILMNLEYDNKAYSDAGLTLCNVNDPVTRWYFRNDNSKWANQASGTSKPTFKSGYIQCDNDDIMTLSPTIDRTTSDWSLYVVMNNLSYSAPMDKFYVLRHDTLGTFISILGGFVPGTYFLNIYVRNNAGVETNLTIASGASPLSGPVLIKASRTGTTLAGKVSSNAEVSTTIGGTSAYTLNTVLDTDYNAGNPQVKRIAFYNKILSASEEAGLAAYFRNKDGINP